ncbi:apolipoprotein N-acyltransferase [Helicobacter sp. CLO-3]|uniref:apolipoprotein N-acyltransferase n=1 Tax=unclassified Helicobacter TaxID=2593540 RepID=UPI000804B095|nr:MULTISPECIES: apolipoprotein N-acyltransferase [unclassified Helicobacter]OBV29812.1 apolipoprotein N-acyltransferase [Helicobacter sp. CLO-3]OHU83962.1 apolipoprotein N-acyltransferase [Helicobacter sp. CLO-3]
MKKNKASDSITQTAKTSGETSNEIAGKNSGENSRDSFATQSCDTKSSHNAKSFIAKTLTRKVFLKDFLHLDSTSSTSWRIFGARLTFGALLAVIFSLWVYGFIFLSRFFDIDASGVSQVLALIAMSVLAFLAIVVWFVVPRKVGAYFGFFMGIFLFYWIGLSFRYTDFVFLMPIVAFSIGIGYAVLFYLALFFDSRIYRIFSLLILGAMKPFGFDWFVPQAWFSYSFFGVGAWDFIFILCAAALVAPRIEAFGRNKCRVIFASSARLVFGVLLLCMAAEWSKSAYIAESSAHLDSATHLDSGNLDSRLDSSAPISAKNSAKPAKSDDFLHKNIYLVQSNIDQGIKWQTNSAKAVNQKVLDAIDSAILESKKMIIFPETILPYILNENAPFQQNMMRELQARSHRIAIVLGALSASDPDDFYSMVLNSSYVFNNGEITILNKVVLAPFGERIPLPDFIAKPLYKAFFDIEDGLGNASEPQDFVALGKVWRNAICYEGTSEALYEKIGKYMVMISNNGWFDPSIEPYMQRILLKYRARAHRTTILHAANKSDSGIISPLIFGDDLSERVRYRLDSPHSAPATQEILQEAQEAQQNNWQEAQEI